jgi:DNA repair exonuclease SbcCD ATPase subunit
MTDKIYTQIELEQAIEEATSSLVKKKNELLAELKTARKNAENSIDADKLQDKIESLETERDTLLKQQKENTKALETATKLLESESGFTSKLLLDNGLTDALVKAGIAPQFLPAAKSLLSTQAKIIAEGDTRKAVIGDKELSAFVKEWTASDEGKHFVQAPTNGGGGADGSKTPNTNDLMKLSPVERMNAARAQAK